MNTGTLKLANTLTGVAVLSMFTVAIVAGQAQGNSKVPTFDEYQFERNASSNLVFELDHPQNLEMLPQIINTVLDLPVKIDIDIRNGKVVARIKRTAKRSN